MKTTHWWHIDYLLSNASFLEVFITKTSQDLECRIANAIGKPILSVPGFGRTDRRGISHLHYSRDLELRRATALAHQTTMEDPD